MTVWHCCAQALCEYAKKRFAEWRPALLSGVTLSAKSPVKTGLQSKGLEQVIGLVPSPILLVVPTPPTLAYVSSCLHPRSVNVVRLLWVLFMLWMSLRGACCSYSHCVPVSS